MIASTAARLLSEARRPSLALVPLRIGVGLLLLFAIVATLVGARRLEEIDQRLMRLATSVASDELDIAVGLISYLAAAEVSLVLMLLLGLSFWRRGLAPGRAAAPLLFLLTLPLEITLKLTLNQPVPSVGFYRQTIRYALLGLTTVQSFPSGHATRTAFMAVLAGYLLVRRIGAPRALPFLAALVALALAAGWSRVYLGYHWPLDVFGGFLLGAGTASIAIAVIEPGRRSAA